MQWGIIMKAHILFDFLHVLFFSLKSYYILGIPIYVFILPVLFVAAYLIISVNQKRKSRSIHNH